MRINYLSNFDVWHVSFPRTTPNGEKRGLVSAGPSTCLRRATIAPPPRACAPDANGLARRERRGSHGHGRAVTKRQDTFRSILCQQEQTWQTPPPRPAPHRAWGWGHSDPATVHSAPGRAGFVQGTQAGGKAAGGHCWAGQHPPSPVSPEPESVPASGNEALVGVIGLRWGCAVWEGTYPGWPTSE